MASVRRVSHWAQTVGRHLLPEGIMSPKLRVLTISMIQKEREQTVTDWRLKRE